MGGSPRRGAFTYLGRTFPVHTGQWFPSVAAFCRTVGLDPKLIYSRIHEGWPLRKALDTPKIEIRQDAGVIYLITRLLTGERYVGLTLISIRYRWRQHVRGAARRGSPLARAIDDDGPEHFTIEPIEENILASDLAERERFWIGHLGTLFPHGLNRHRGGAMGGGGRREMEHQGEHFSSVALASAALAERYNLTESATHQRLRKGKSLEAPLKVMRTRGRGVAGSFLWSRWRAMRNNATSELGPEWQDWDQFAADLAHLRRNDRMVRNDRTAPWGPDNYTIHRNSYSDHPRVGTTHWQRWRNLLKRAEKPGDRGIIEEWRDFDRFEADIAEGYCAGDVMIPLDWYLPWGPNNFAWGTQSDLSRLVGIHGNKRILHGEHNSATYKRWASMKNDARRTGHAVDPAWLNYARFREDVGSGIEEGLVLLRPDHALPFGPSNFRLVTRAERHANPTKLTHGQTGTRLHKRWGALRQRAAGNGGCDPRWDSFEAFAEDVGEDRPGFNLERLDASKPYGPGNFTWIDREVRRNEVENRRVAKRARAQEKREMQAITVSGVTYRGLYALAKAYGVPAATVCLRVRQGMTAEAAVTTPNKNMASAKPVSLDGRDFPSMKAATRYIEDRYGIRANTLQLRLKSGLSLEEAAHKPLRSHNSEAAGRRRDQRAQRECLRKK